MSEVWSHPLMENLPRLGRDIEKCSHEIIAEQLKQMGLSFDEELLPVVTRTIHATADLDFGRTLRFSEGAVRAGCAAIQAGKPVFCDVNMLRVGITAGVKTECVIKQEEVAELARRNGTTRSAAAIEFLGERLNGAIVAVGNAPTALWKILELAETRGIRPALVVGLPVGFVGAAESKQALLESDLTFITNVGPRGGTPLAAAAVNALTYQSKSF